MEIYISKRSEFKSDKLDVLRRTSEERTTNTKEKWYEVSKEEVKNTFLRRYTNEQIDYQGNGNGLGDQEGVINVI